MVQAYVIDTSALIQAFIQDTFTTQALSLIKQVFTAGVLLHTPEFVLLECGNIVWKQTQFGGLSLSGAQTAIKKIQSVPIKYHIAIQFLPRAIEIGVQNRLAIYDSIVVTLAENLRLPLITHDQRQATIAQAIGITVKPLNKL